MHPTVYAIIKHGILFSALFSFLVSIAQLLLRKRTVSHYMLIAVSIAIGITQLYGFFNMANVLFEIEFLNYIFVPVNYFIGPSCYFYFFVTLENRYKLDKKKLLAFLPGTLLLLSLPVLQLIDSNIFPPVPQTYFQGQDPSLFDKMFFLAFMYNNVFYYLIYRRGSVVFNFRSLRDETSARAFLGIFIFVGIINVYAILIYFLRDINHMYYCSFLITLVICAFFVFSQRYTEFFWELEDAIAKARYKTSQLDGLDLKKIHLELIELMNNEKLYLDEGLTLKKVADKLNLKSYQMSEFLNRHLGMNFSKFVNNFRVEKAVRMLLEEKDANILSVAFRVGFNSKATFNVSFQNLKGMTPTEFLKARGR